MCKLVKLYLYTLNICGSLYISYISIKLLKTQQKEMQRRPRRACDLRLPHLPSSRSWIASGLPPLDSILAFLFPIASPAAHGLALGPGTGYCHAFP